MVYKMLMKQYNTNGQSNFVLKWYRRGAKSILTGVLDDWNNMVLLINVQGIVQVY